MYRLALSLFTAALVLTVGSNRAVIHAEDKDGYVSLFNGKDLKGWKLHPETNKASIKDVTPVMKDGAVVAYEGIDLKTKDKSKEKFKLWRVEDGMLIGGGQMSHLFTEKDDYKNFRLRVEVKINDKGNSGLFFRAGFEAPIPKGYEAQINATHSDRIKTGSIYPNARFGLDKYKAETCIMDQAANKPDVFYVQEVEAIDDTITVFVDGKQVMKWKDPEHRFKSGHFALQAHDPGSIMTFRKVEVKVLK